jgi:hypothetical protein
MRNGQGRSIVSRRQNTARPLVERRDYHDPTDADIATMRDEGRDAVLRKGLIIAVATIGEGPNAGQSVASITSRRRFRRSMKRIARYARDAAFVASVCAAIRAAVTSPLFTQTRPKEDQDLMDDLLLLLSIRFSLASKAPDREVAEKLAQASGLFVFGFAVSDDEGRPWDQRGFLEPGHAGRPVSRFAA